MIRDALDLARRSAALPRFLRRPLDLPAAIAAVGAGVRGREAAFLAVLEQLVFGVATSPLRRLLVWAGCTPGDLRGLVAAEGVEGTLARLRTAGVFVTADEMRGRVPLRRSGLEMALTPEDFDNPRLHGGVGGATSGSTGRRVPVRYDWPFLASEAAGELLLLESHGLCDAPLAFWMPGPPGIAGLHNLLVHARLGQPPERWFSSSPPPRRNEGLAFWVDRGWRAARRLLPRLGPAPEWVPAERADEVARWLAGSSRPAALKCFASSALRVASAAVAAGLDLSRHVVFAGGEPLTAARRDFLARSGLRVFARYAATEAGFIAGACPRGEDGGEMHLYSDRLALIGPEPGGLEPAPFAFTILSLAAPKVLLNAELGDQGLLRRRACECVLGRAGLEWHVRDVHSPAKIAAEGVKLGELDFARLVEEAARDLGGNPDELQIWLGTGAGDDGASRITLVLAPGAALDPEALQRRLRERLPELSGGSLAAKLWFAGSALTIERRLLRLGPGQKMRRIVRETTGSADAL
ncbi:MAG TPA: hypothetical protein VIE43_27290 [Thermoanaerobaculia bacterium]|nr:hypothetical protein [Thermoanaerobaculia bacterium]